MVLMIHNQADFGVLKNSGAIAHTFVCLYMNIVFSLHSRVFGGFCEDR